MQRRITLVLLLCLVPLSVLWAHRGRTDSLGCHHDRKAGGYHCHSGELAGRSFSTKAEAEKALKEKQKPTPASQQPSASTETSAAEGAPDVKVWVNTSSGVYHCPGARWYGTTKQGKYMSQREAKEKGHRPAYGKPC